jgi:hypothetical protein
MKVFTKKNAVLFLLLVALDVAARLTPHAPNFTPLAATALFASFLFESSALAALVPGLALGISDCFLGAYDWRIMISVYASLAFPVLLRRYLKADLAAGRIFGSALVSSILFFAATNFAVWSFAGFYTRDLHGLLQCYLAAIPFFQNTLAGDIVWTAALFGSYAVARKLVSALHGSRQWAAINALN